MFGVVLRLLRRNERLNTVPGYQLYASRRTPATVRQIPLCSRPNKKEVRPIDSVPGTAVATGDPIGFVEHGEVAASTWCMCPWVRLFMHCTPFMPSSGRYTWSGMKGVQPSCHMGTQEDIRCCAHGNRARLFTHGWVRVDFRTGSGLEAGIVSTSFIPMHHWLARSRDTSAGASPSALLGWIQGPGASWTPTSSDTALCSGWRHDYRPWRCISHVEPGMSQHQTDGACCQQEHAECDEPVSQIRKVEQDEWPGCP